MSRTLILPNSIRERIIQHALAERPLECVGLLAGRGDVVERDFRLVNEATSPTRFFAAESLFQPMRDMREAGLDLLGIYHSHPETPAIPSRRDIEENFYPDAVHVIVSLFKSPLSPCGRGAGGEGYESHRPDLHQSNAVNLEPDALARDERLPPVRSPRSHDTAHLRGWLLRDGEAEEVDLRITSP